MHKRPLVLGLIADRVFEVTGLDEDPLHAGYWAHRHDYDRGTLSGRDYWHAVASHAATRGTPAARIAA